MCFNGAAIATEERFEMVIFYLSNIISLMFVHIIFSKMRMNHFKKSFEFYGIFNL